MMRMAMIGCAVAAVSCVVSCASYPAPSEHLASSMAAVRGAQELGAQQVPQAALHLKLAEEQIAAAKDLMKDGKNERADYLTLRAYNDAALAMALTREEAARARAKQIMEQSSAATPPR